MQSNIYIIHFDKFYFTDKHIKCIPSFMFPVEYVIHMLTYVEGVPLRERRPREPQTWFRLGQLLGHAREALKVIIYGTRRPRHKRLIGS